MLSKYLYLRDMHVLVKFLLRDGTVYMNFLFLMDVYLSILSTNFVPSTLLDYFFNKPCADVLLRCNL